MKTKQQDIALVNQGLTDVKNLTKQQILEKTKEIDGLLNNGEIDVYEVLAFAKRYETVGKELVEVCKKHGVEPNSKYGISITEISKYDYSTCGDSELDNLIKQEQELKNKITERKKFLSSIPKEGVVEPNTGEFIYPALKGKSVINISLK